MKVVTIFLFFLISLFGNAQNGKPIYSLSGQHVSPIESMIEPIGKNCERLTLRPFQPSQFVSVGNTRYEIKMATNIDDEESDGFNAIEICKGTNKLLGLKDYDMWTYLFRGKTGFNYEKYTDNRYFIPIELKDNIKALCFVGWPYGGDLSLLTIIILTEEDAKVVFNKHLFIESISKNGNEYSMKIQTNLEEFDSSGVQTIFARYTTMYSKDGILYIK